MVRAAAFLDRDGVINVDRGYVGHWRDFEFCPGAIQALERLQAAGLLLVVVSNQSGVARGLYTQADVHRLHSQMQNTLGLRGVQLSSILFCPHLPPGEATVAAYSWACSCRKPAPGLLLRAQQALNIDMAASVMFGDKMSDIDAAGRAGVACGVLVDRAGRTEPEAASASAAGGGVPGVAVCVRVNSLSAGADWWLARAGRLSSK